MYRILTEYYDITYVNITYIETYLNEDISSLLPRRIYPRIFFSTSPLSIKLKYVSIKCFRLNLQFLLGLYGTCILKRQCTIAHARHEWGKFVLLLPQQVPLRNYRFY